MNWGVDSNIFIHLGRLKFELYELIVALLDFCERVCSTKVEKVCFLKRQVGHMDIVKELGQLVQIEALDEIYSDEDIMIRLVELKEQMNSIKGNDPMYEEYKEVKKYMSHFYSEESDIYDICFLLAHEDGRISYSISCDKKLTVLLKSFGYNSYLCKDKHLSPEKFFDEKNFL